MSSKALFGNNIPPACAYCENGIPEEVSGMILCSRKGIVQPDAKCKHFFYDPLRRVPKRPRQLEQYDEESFQL